jgi:tRNA(Ile2) C34 agmatinyltransferase TiaS
VYKHVEGYSFCDEINFCPACGGGIESYYSGGYAKCVECKKKFAVIFAEEEN